MSNINYASPEIFAAVFGTETTESVLSAAEESGYTVQDYVMSHVIEARKCGLETAQDDAFWACCEELRVPAM